MHLPIEYLHTHIANIGSGNRSFFHLFHDAFKYGRNEARVDHTAYNAVVKREFTTPWQVENFFSTHAIVGGFGHALVPGLYFEMYLGKLTGAARLFLVSITGNGGLANSFPVGNPWRHKLDVQL